VILAVVVAHLVTARLTPARPALTSAPAGAEQPPGHVP
jgi:hypothetical protein